jgi:hypothetical protein
MISFMTTNHPQHGTETTQAVELTTFGFIIIYYTTSIASSIPKTHNSILTIKL